MRRFCVTKPPVVDVAQELLWLADRARQTVLLHPLPEDGLRRDASKVGGDLVWPARQPWPFCAQHGSAYVGILQLWRSDIPELLWPPGTDLFQVLWCPFEHPMYGYDLSGATAPGPLAIWRRSKDLGDLLPIIPAPSSVANQFYLPRLCSICPETVVEYPHLWELSAEEQTALAHWQPSTVSLTSVLDWPPDRLVGSERTGAILYAQQLSAAPGMKIGGYADWRQDPEVPRCGCGSTMVHLLTVSDYEFTDDGFLRWWPAELPWPGGALLNEVQTPMDLSLFGKLYLFVCTQCEPWCVQPVFQR